MTGTSLVLFTRDLRVHDNPTLWAAAEGGGRLVTLFVLDETILGSRFNSPNRAAFLVGSLRVLDTSLKKLGGDGLVVRRGDVVTETARVADQIGADTVHLSTDWSRYARTREQRLRDALAPLGAELHSHEETREDTLRDRPPAPGSHGLLMAMGPGFCSELVLLRATGSGDRP